MEETVDGNMLEEVRQSPWWAHIPKCLSQVNVALFCEQRGRETRTPPL